MKRQVPRLGPNADFAKGELIGLACSIVKANDAALVGLAGDVIDETLHTFTLRIGGPGGRRVRVAKAGAVFRFQRSEGGFVDLDGRALEFRSADRTKKVR